MPDATQSPEKEDARKEELRPKFPPNGDGHKPDDHTAHVKYAPSGDKKEDSGGGDKKDEDKKPADPRKKALGIAVGAVVLILALLWGIRYYHYAKTHTSTDDAYVEGNLVNVSPIISGTLSTLTVEEGDIVHKGQLIGRIEDSGQLASLRQAQAAYDAAQSQVPQAKLNLTYQQAATDAAIRRAQAGLGSQTAKTEGARQQVVLSASTTLNQIRQAESQVAQAKAQAAGADAQVDSARAALSAQRQTVQTAQRSAYAAAAQIAAAQANSVKATNDENRYARLVAQQAITPQQYDAAQAAAVSARSQLEAVTQQSAGSLSGVTQARRNVEQSAAQLAAAQKQADAAHQQVDVARAGLGLARANQTQVGIQQANVANNAQQGGQAEADLLTAQAGQEQVRVRRAQVTTAQAQAEQAHAALVNARITENDTFLYAPTDGQVVRKSVNVGASLSSGQTVVTISQKDYVWVTANFKETQLTNVRVGQPAEVEVDRNPGKIYRGRVQAINDATGASTALLPPDNATGNFTKVVQRVPVRIQLVAARQGDDDKYATQANINDLHQGLSVTATIDTSDAADERAHNNGQADPQGGGPASPTGGQSQSGGGQSAAPSMVGGSASGGSPSPMGSPAPAGGASGGEVTAQPAPVNSNGNVQSNNAQNGRQNAPSNSGATGQNAQSGTNGQSASGMSTTGGASTNGGTAAPGVNGPQGGTGIGTQGNGASGAGSQSTTGANGPSGANGTGAASSNGAGAGGGASGGSAGAGGGG